MSGRTRSVLAAVVAALSLAAVAAPASAGAVRNVQITDRCDPASFNAMFGPGVCTIRHSGVNVNTFLARLNPKDGGHSAWRFSPGQLRLKPGTTLQLNNRGGEAHSFTEVVDFGATPIPELALLNNALPPGTPFAVPVGADLQFIPAGGQLNMPALAPGTYRFECLIHPWMRATVEQG